MVRVTVSGPELAGFTVEQPAASVRVLLPSPGAPAAATAPPLEQLDRAADTLALAIAGFDLRAQLFASRQMHCPELTRGLVLVEDFGVPVPGETTLVLAAVYAVPDPVVGDRVMAALELSTRQNEKALAQAGVASRRSAEHLIEQRRVEVDGEVVTEFGLRVDVQPETADVPHLVDALAEHAARLRAEGALPPPRKAKRARRS